jgi:hypothetical protein
LTASKVLTLHDDNGEEYEEHTIGEIHCAPHSGAFKGAVCEDTILVQASREGIELCADVVMLTPAKARKLIRLLETAAAKSMRLRAAWMVNPRRGCNLVEVYPSSCPHCGPPQLEFNTGDVDDVRFMARVECDEVDKKDPHGPKYTHWYCKRCKRHVTLKGLEEAQRGLP